MKLPKVDRVTNSIMELLTDEDCFRIALRHDDSQLIHEEVYE